jgi:subtilisin family serine protease
MTETGVPTSSGSSPLASNSQQLRTIQHARKAPLGHLLRKALPHLDGTGTRTFSLEPGINPTDYSQSADHAIRVSSIITDPTIGIAPGSEFTPIATPDQPESPLEDTASSLTDRVVTRTSGAIEQITSTLAQKKASLVAGDVINISYGPSIITAATKLYDLVVENTEQSATGELKPEYPNLRRALLGDNADTLSETEKRKKVLDYVSSALKDNPVVQQSLQQWQNITDELKQKGVIIVTAAGNDGNSLYFEDIEHDPSAEQNYLSQSHSVISVGNADANGTFLDPTDDTIHPDSSTGDGQQFNPTIAAPGTNLLTANRYVRPRGNSFQRYTGGLDMRTGTSFGAPVVTSTIALILQNHQHWLQAPAQLFDRVKRALIATAHPSPDSSTAGSGFLNPLAAINFSS